MARAGMDWRLFDENDQMDEAKWLERHRAHLSVGRCILDDCDGSLTVMEPNPGWAWETTHQGRVRHYIGICSKCGNEIVKLEQRNPRAKTRAA